MKNFLLFILVLVTKVLVACGYYPYGDDTRVSLLNPRLLGYLSFAEFNYSASSFEKNEELDSLIYNLQANPNIELWYTYCNKKVSKQEIYLALKTEVDISNKNAHNEFITYLYKCNDLEAITYLQFAKKCESFNSCINDPWEKETHLNIPKRGLLINQAVRLSNQVKNAQIKRRYAFLAIRLAWYNNQFNDVKKIFKRVFNQSSEKDIIYYWSLYFVSITESNKSLANFYLAQVFAFVTEKRFICHLNYSSRIPIQSQLNYATTNQEKANVYILASIEKPDKCLLYLKQIYQLNPSSEGLSFLLLRELNKIEDFILTPYYTLFQPSLTYNFWLDETPPSSNQILKRAEKDREYAKKVLSFVNSVDLSKVNNPFAWKLSKAYLRFMTKDFNGSVLLFDELLKTLPDTLLINQIKQLKALSLTAMQPMNKATLLPQIQQTLVANINNTQFLFAVAKELEYKGNTAYAAILYSKLQNEYYGWESDIYSSSVVWKAKKISFNGYSDFFTNYFDYIDIYYTVPQLKNLITEIEVTRHKTDSFSNFLFNELRRDLPRLYDLLGTKYIRKNKLQEALVAFKNAGNSYWSRAYTLWEDGGNIFDKNPFYVLKYTPNFITPLDTIRLNKYIITQQLINYLTKANNPIEPNRAYYYFLVANAYYNMGFEGNIWMFRRFGRWSSYTLTSLEDEVEFRQTTLAKLYYIQALNHSKNARFKALCLRMAAKCESNKLAYNQKENYYFRSELELFEDNKYLHALLKQYPDYYEELVSNCDRFETYFNAHN